MRVNVMIVTDRSAQQDKLTGPELTALNTTIVNTIARVPDAEIHNWVNRGSRFSVALRSNNVERQVRVTVTQLQPDDPPNMKVEIERLPNNP